MQRRCSTHCVATLILLLAIVRSLEADFDLKVELSKYASSQHTRVDGFCCDGGCTDCDNQFLFCLRPSDSPRSSEVISRDDEDCPLGSYKTGNISGDDGTFELGMNLDTGVPNPMTFTLEAWPGSVELYVRVDDVDLPDQAFDGPDLVAQFDIPLVLNSNISRIEPRQFYDRIFHGTFLILGTELRCAENFYGDDCSLLCVPRDDELGHYKCDENGRIECLDGYQDTTENCTVCTLSEGCSSEGGYCNATDRCICYPNYTGSLCEIDLDPCGHNAPCLHNGICTNNQTALDGYTCTCSEDYGGTNCELDLNVCGRNEPCMNNATCVNTGPNDYDCECVPGYEGKDCELETNECDSTPCKNGATCEDLHPLGYTCHCALGFTGTTCETDINECDTDPCLNGGTCRDMVGTYECVCEESFSGDNCQVRLAVTFDYAPIIGGVATAAVMLFIILLLMITLLYLVKQRRKLKISTITSQQNSEPQDFRVHNPTYREFEAKQDGTEDTNESKSVEHKFDNPIYGQTTRLDVPEGQYSRLDSRMGPNNNLQRGIVQLSPHYSRINDATFGTPLHKHHQYEYIDREDSESPNGTGISSINPLEHKYDYADTILKSEDGPAGECKPIVHHYDQAEGVEVVRTRPVHQYEDIDQEEENRDNEDVTNTKEKPVSYDHLDLSSPESEGKDVVVATDPPAAYKYDYADTRNAEAQDSELHLYDDTV